MSSHLRKFGLGSKRWWQDGGGIGSRGGCRSSFPQGSKGAFSAEIWLSPRVGGLMARGSKIGLNLSVMDAFFAATAAAHGFTLVTRNTKHFERLGASLINPWLERW
jgi:hypothetical protein